MRLKSRARAAGGRFYNRVPLSSFQPLHFRYDKLRLKSTYSSLRPADDTLEVVCGSQFSGLSE